MPPSPSPYPAPVTAPKVTYLNTVQRQVLPNDEIKNGSELKRTTTVVSEDVPTTYRVANLRSHEFPVVGLAVHSRIIPGFSYRVRPLSTSKHLFNGKALRLLSIGQGYGKRITFEADHGCKNENKNFFWSDSRPEGYGFELEVVAPGDKLSLYDSHHVKVGNVEVICNEEPQVEQSHLIWPENGTIEKWVVIKLRCKMESLEFYVSETCVISGIAIASKSSRTGTASLVRIMNCKIFYPHTQKILKSGLTLTPGVDNQMRRVTLTGGDIPTMYTITGLLAHEFPVIGTHVDIRIIPGFHYVVRPAHHKNPLFGGKPLCLVSIGKGYGKRITFEAFGSNKNQNDNFFWSDSYSEGFGFSPIAVFQGHRFRMFVGNEEIGVAVVKKVEKPQEEIQMSELPAGGFLKRIRIEVTCEMEVRSVATRSCRIFGIAVVVKRDMRSKGVVESIENVGLDTVLCKNFRYVQTAPVRFVAEVINSI